MAWRTQLPTEKPAVPGWFAIINLLAGQQFSIDSAGPVIGVTLAPQYLPLVTQGLVTETLADVVAGQTIPVVTTADLIGMQAAGQSFNIVSAAEASSPANAEQIIGVTSSGATVGISTANVSFAIGTLGNVFALVEASNSLSMTTDSTFNGNPTAPQSFSIDTLATAEQVSVKPTIIGSLANSGNSIVIPAHSAGDLILLAAYRAFNNVLPTKPTPAGNVPNWVDLHTNPGTNNCCMRTAQFVATSSFTESGAWTGATLMCAIVIRNQHLSSPIGGNAETGGAASSTATSPAITMSRADNTSLLISFHGRNNVLGAWDSSPSGYSRLAEVNGLCANSKDNTSSDGACAQAGLGATAVWRAATIEVLAI